MTSRLLVGGLVVGCGAALGLRPPFWLVRLVATWRSDILFHVVTTEPLVALTLDDGPDETTTAEVLELLRRHDAHATFFVLGKQAQANRALVARIVAAGHEVGNHQWDDTPANRLSLGEFERQLLASHAELSQTVVPRLFRPGSGWVGRQKIQLCRRNGYRCVLGSIYPYDAHLPLGRVMTVDLVRRARPGTILILHEGDPSRARVVGVLDALLVGLRRRGFEVVSVSELLARSGTQG